MSILFPLGIGFLGFGAYEYSQYGFTEHVGILFFMGAPNMVCTLFKVARRT